MPRIMHIPLPQLQKIVVDSGLASEEDFLNASAESQRLRKDILEIILGKGLVRERYLMEGIAEYLGMRVYNIHGKEVPRNFTLLPETFAKNRGVFVLEAKGDGTAVLGMLDPLDYLTKNFVEGKLGVSADVALVSPADFEELLKLYKQNIGAEFQEIIKEHIAQVSGSGKKAELLAQELPVISILDLILEHAIANKASDIHIEPEEAKVLVRYRIDGILHDVIELPGLVHSALTARIKILSNLQIDEHRVPQDGRFKIEKGEEEIAVRVSIMPTLHGEKSALRVLISSGRFLSLNDLGLEGKNLEAVSNAIKKKNGLLLVTGPTGSGKTTTLYTILGMLNKPEVNIATIEDPIEYSIPRINQTQVNTRTGLTFAEALRSFLRQNPDIMMAGEIRDNETAELAIHAALTGHLMLSTLHTDDAPTAIPRLIDLGVEPFLLTSVLRTVIAQRLVRRVCNECVGAEEIPQGILAIVQEQLARSNPKYRVQESFKIKEIYKGKGCVSCGNSGFRGVIGIFEVLDVTPEISELILSHVSTDKVKELAFTQGYVTMLEDGVLKAQKGLTTIDEVLRVIRT